MGLIGTTMMVIGCIIIFYAATIYSVKNKLYPEYLFWLTFAMCVSVTAITIVSLVPAIIEVVVK